MNTLREKSSLMTNIQDKEDFTAGEGHRKRTISFEFIPDLTIEGK